MSLRYTSRLFSTTTSLQHLRKMADRCYIVPPHLLSAIAESTHNDETTRESARASLVSREQVSTARKEVFAALTMPHGYRRDAAAEARRQIIPEGMLTHIAESESVDEETRARAKRDLLHLQDLFSKIKTSQEGSYTLILFLCRFRMLTHLRSNWRNPRPCSSQGQRLCLQSRLRRKPRHQ